MHPFVNTAVKAARKAGDMMMIAQLDIENVEIAVKTKNSFVTSVDHAAEAQIIQMLHKAYPHHNFLAEESGETLYDETGDFQWIIDPLDGTTNFIHSYPYFCISIALKIKDRIEHAVIYDPVKQDIFTASRGEGAQKNNRKMRVSKTLLLENAMIGASAPNSSSECREHFFNAVHDLSMKTRSIRLAGSAALDLAYVASGQLDAYWAMRLSPWDLAAGSLLIREAGGQCMDFKGGENFLESGQIIAGNIKLIKSLFEEIHPHLPKT